MPQSTDISNTRPASSPIPVRERLPPNVALLGVVSLLTAMSSAMVYSLLPLFIVKVLGSTAAVLGVIEGMAEGSTSLLKMVSGRISDWAGRRKPLVLLGYALSAFNKLLFPIAAGVPTITLARVMDRVGKGIRDAPRDAFLTDVIPFRMRGSGFGLRLAFYTSGYVLGPLAAIGLMLMSGDDFRLVFWIAVIPAFAALFVLAAVKELPSVPDAATRRLAIRLKDIGKFPTAFWWTIAIASCLSLARYSQAFLILKANHVGVDAAFVPLILVLSHTVYAASAYPFGALADWFDRRNQLGIGILTLILAHLILAFASTLEMTILGAAIWGLQLAITQGLLAASVADSAPTELRGTAFGIFELANGIAIFAANAGAGVLWLVGGPAFAFFVGASVAAGAMAVLLISGPVIGCPAIEPMQSTGNHSTHSK
jgi:MFS family permease